MVWKSTTLFIVIKAKKHQRKHPCGLINNQHMNISHGLFKIVPNEEKLTSRPCFTSYQLHTLVACGDKGTNRTLTSSLSQTALGFSFICISLNLFTGQPWILFKHRTVVHRPIYISLADNEARNK